MNVIVTYLHEMASGIDLKDCGRLRKKDCILARASTAVPSTTSITINPTTELINSLYVAWTAIAPPMLCPIRIVGGGEPSYMVDMTSAISLFRISRNYVSFRFASNDSHTIHCRSWFTQSHFASVLSDKSSSFTVFVLPWPLISMATIWHSTIEYISSYYN